MQRTSLDTWDIIPEGMKAYLRNYGWNFSKKAVDFATAHMYIKNAATGNRERLKPVQREEVDIILDRNGVKLENKTAYNHVYVFNMAKADFLHSSIQDEQHLALYVKDVIDDPDGVDGMVFNRWYADMCKMGIPIEWEEII